MISASCSTSGAATATRRLRGAALLRPLAVRRSAAARAAAARTARFGGASRGGVADRPADVSVVERAGWDSDRDLGGVATLPKPDEGDGAASGRGGGAGGHYRLLLLDAPHHTEKRVVSGICGVVNGVDEARARNCYETSKALGMAIVTSCLREHAEFYQQQLYVHGVKTKIEPDTAAA